MSVPTFLVGCQPSWPVGLTFSQGRNTPCHPLSSLPPPPPLPTWGGEANSASQHLHPPRPLMGSMVVSPMVGQLDGTQQFHPSLTSLPPSPVGSSAGQPGLLGIS